MELWLQPLGASQFPQEGELRTSKSELLQRLYFPSLNCLEECFFLIEVYNALRGSSRFYL